jgi:hypothetical protein
MENEMGWVCSTYGEKISACSNSVGKSEEQIQLGRPRRRREDIIIDLI